MKYSLLLCSDLDRTLLPNGTAAESPQARPLLHALARHPEVGLVYVSGRDRGLLQLAISEYRLPLPDYAIGDVGSTIYQVGAEELWQPWPAWDEAIGPDWRGLTRVGLARLLVGIPGLQPQEEAKQNRWKLSYYAPADGRHGELLAQVRGRLEREAIRASLIWSIDDLTGEGLLDILPAAASKLHAIRFLIERLGLAESAVVFAGDSGNDLPVLVSGLQAVLVHNARDEVRREALAGARAHPGRLYLAQGGFLGMNGNYSAGVLEGVAHFRPELGTWLQGELACL